MTPSSTLLNRQIAQAIIDENQTIQPSVSYGDYYSNTSITIHQQLQFLLDKDEEIANAFYQQEQENNIVRIVITSSLLNSNFLEEKLRTLQENNYLKSNFIAIDFNISDLNQIDAALLLCDLRTEIINLLSHANLIFCNSRFINTLFLENITEEKNLKCDDSYAFNNALLEWINTVKTPPALVIYQEETSQWIYSDKEKEAVFSYPANLEGNINQSALLSASTCSFMLLGKRTCDALVLAFSYLKQNDGDSNKAEQQAFDGLWPTTLANFPDISTAINRAVKQPFPSSDSFSLGLYPVVDSIDWLERLLELDIKTIQLRVKDVPLNILDKYIEIASALGKKHKARLFINDYWQLAIKHQCYGVHLGQEDLDDTNLCAIQEAGLKLGISTHSEYEWLRAISIHPTYIAMGTVYPTQTKPAILIGLSNLRHWCKTLANDYPIVAIGGIKLSNIDPVIDTGVGSVAVVTAITEASDYKEAARLLTSKQKQQMKM